MMPAVALAEGAPLIGLAEVASLSAATLAKLFVLAVVVENGLAVLFNWRVFLMYFSLRGVRTLISVGVSWLIVVSFDINIVRELLEAYSGSAQTDYFGAGLLTALVIAGGSSGVNNLMRSLGYRDIARDPPLLNQPPGNRAWVSVTVNRKSISSPVMVQIKRASDSSTQPATAGVCFAPRPSLISLFFPANNRFPRSGGYELEPNVPWTIQVSTCRDNGDTVIRPVSKDPIVLAPGAILDLEASV